MRYRRRQQLRIHKDFLVSFTALLVGIHGAFLLATTLVDQLSAHRNAGTPFSVDLPLVIGFSLMYLSSRLLRRKRTAWIAALASYAFIIGLYTIPFLLQLASHTSDPDHWVRAVALPICIVSLLVVERRKFIVLSDVAAFRSSLKFVTLILLAAFFYGVSGFLLLDQHDFHQELSISEAAHYTIDQFDLTTSHPLRPHTKRAHVFVDSLSVVSVAALGYIALSLFQPLRSRLHDQGVDRQRMDALLRKYKAPSEDFFKLWPHDKHYYFNEKHSAGLAYHVYRGIALCLADPAGDPKAFNGLLKGFEELCYRNDWLSAFIHVEERNRKLYERNGFQLQKIGQEAAVSIDHYETVVRGKKYFRHIHNRFEREGYSAELLQPPHHQAVMDRLKVISDEWLSKPGRVERGFVMGYYSEPYLQRCPILVARDAAGTIQGFMNQLPAPFDTEEATYDMLRQTSDCLGNTNDFLLMSFIENMKEQGYSRVNLGLSPLVGLDDESDENTSIVDNFLRFAYANGDRFYSFSGLHRFKAKYEPDWRDRFVAYRGGVPGFARTMNALLRTMQLRQRR